MSVRVNFTFEKSEICIENSIKPKRAISVELWVVEEISFHILNFKIDNSNFNENYLSIHALIARTRGDTS